MIGVIERVKNNVLMKCSNLNDNFINNNLEDLINKSIYRFAEELSNLIIDIGLGINEQELRDSTSKIIKLPIIKKIKRKLFIDSLALQITNDSYIEDYVNRKIEIDSINKKYLKELSDNEKSNQLNMTEDLDLTEVMQKLMIEVDTNIINKIRENEFVVKAINDLLRKTKTELEENLTTMFEDLDREYLNILINELETEVEFEENEITVNEEGKGESNMMPEISNYDYKVEEETKQEPKTEISFDKYDDMTLYNKMILGLNTKEEKLSRSERKLSEKRAQIEEVLAETNKKIEANIERENKLSQRKLDLSTREKDLNARLSEAEVIFLNMKPLIKGLNSIRSLEEGGSSNE